MLPYNTPLSRLLNEKREEVLAICAKHGARNVRVFGSVARGEDGPDSDIDLLVDMDKGRSYFDLVDLDEELNALFHREVDVVTARGISPYMRESILSATAAL